MNDGASDVRDPCRGCAFDWSISQGDADALIAQTPARFVAIIGDRDGSQRDPALEWTAGGYVCHVADSLRVWAERLANVALGDPGPVAEYNQDKLAVGALVRQGGRARSAVVARTRSGRLAGGR